MYEYMGVYCSYSDLHLVFHESSLHNKLAILDNPIGLVLYPLNSGMDCHIREAMLVHIVLICCITSLPQSLALSLKQSMAHAFYLMSDCVGHC